MFVDYRKNDYTSILEGNGKGQTESMDVKFPPLFSWYWCTRMFSTIKSL